MNLKGGENQRNSAPLICLYWQWRPDCWVICRWNPQLIRKINMDLICFILPLGGNNQKSGILDLTWRGIHWIFASEKNLLTHSQQYLMLPDAGRAFGIGSWWYLILACGDIPIPFELLGSPPMMKGKVGLYGMTPKISGRQRSVEGSILRN